MMSSALQAGIMKPSVWDCAARRLLTNALSSWQGRGAEGFETQVGVMLEWMFDHGLATEIDQFGMKGSA